MHWHLKHAALGLCALMFSACAASNPNSEVVEDTSAKTKQVVPGEPQRVVPASTLGRPTVGDE